MSSCTYDLFSICHDRWPWYMCLVILSSPSLHGIFCFLYLLLLLILHPWVGEDRWKRKMYIVFYAHFLICYGCFLFRFFEYKGSLHTLSINYYSFNLFCVLFDICSIVSEHKMLAWFLFCCAWLERMLFTITFFPFFLDMLLSLYESTVFSFLREIFIFLFLVVIRFLFNTIYSFFRCSFSHPLQTGLSLFHWETSQVYNQSVYGCIKYFFIYKSE